MAPHNARWPTPTTTIASAAQTRPSAEALKSSRSFAETCPSRNPPRAIASRFKREPVIRQSVASIKNVPATITADTAESGATVEANRVAASPPPTTSRNKARCSADSSTASDDGLCESSLLNTRRIPTCQMISKSEASRETGTNTGCSIASDRSNIVEASGTNNWIVPQSTCQLTSINATVLMTGCRRCAATSSNPSRATPPATRIGKLKNSNDTVAVSPSVASVQPCKVLVTTSQPEATRSLLDASTAKTVTTETTPQIVGSHSIAVRTPTASTARTPEFARIVNHPHPHNIADRYCLAASNVQTMVRIETTQRPNGP